jgi:hypothetical protein
MILWARLPKQGVCFCCSALKSKQLVSMFRYIRNTQRPSETNWKRGRRKWPCPCPRPYPLQKVSVCFETPIFFFGSFRNGSETPKQPKIYLTSLERPKQNQNGSSFGLFRFELKQTIVCFEDTPCRWRAAQSKIFENIYTSYLGCR